MCKSNISGTGAGMNLIFGLNWKLGSLILICVVVYTYFAKNVYSKVEKLIRRCTNTISSYSALYCPCTPETPFDTYESIRCFVFYALKALQRNTFNFHIIAVCFAILKKGGFDPPLRAERR